MGGRPTVKRIRELNARLRPYTEIPNDREELLNSLPPNIWSKLLQDAPKLSGICNYWFRAGILRAITEMRRTDADGAPVFRNRQQLIDHLKTIERP